MSFKKEKRSRKITDPVRFMILLDVACNLSLKTLKDYLHYYTFFAGQNKVPFTYSFRVGRGLYSSMLDVDITTLKSAEYIKMEPRGYRVTDKGYEWLSLHSEEEIALLKNQIQSSLEDYKEMNEIALFKRAHALITKKDLPIPETDL